VVAVTCLSVGGERCCKITPLFENRPEVERAGGVAAVICPSVGVNRMSHLALLFEQHAKVGSSAGMAALIGATEGRLCSGQLAVLFEHEAEIERVRSIAALVSAPIGVLPRRDLSPVTRRHANLPFKTIATPRLRHYRRPAKQRPIWLTPSSSRRLELQIIRRVDGS
jgi:hypothetical protein